MSSLGDAVRVVGALAECIREHGEGGIPSGHLYAASMNAFASVTAFDDAIRVLKNAGLVKETSDNMLVWVGPKHIAPRMQP